MSVGDPMHMAQLEKAQVFGIARQAVEAPDVRMYGAAIGAAWLKCGREGLAG